MDEIQFQLVHARIIEFGASSVNLFGNDRQQTQARQATNTSKTGNKHKQERDMENAIKFASNQ